MTIYNLYMNNTEPLTPYDLITIAEHNKRMFQFSNDIVWRGAFFNLPEEYKFAQLFSYEICNEYNYRHAYVII